VTRDYALARGREDAGGRAGVRALRGRPLRTSPARRPPAGLPQTIGYALRTVQRVPELQFDGRRRVVIESVTPSVDEGRFPAKRAVGDVVHVEADIFADGHDLLSAVMLHRHESEKTFTETRMTALVNDRWRAELPVDRLGFYYFTFEAWIDHFLTWHRDLKKRPDADLDVQLRIGLEMIRASADRATDRDRKRLDHYVTMLDSDDDARDKVHALANDDLLDLMARNAERKFATRHGCELAIEVDPRRAAFSTWYELFPRS